MGHTQDQDCSPCSGIPQHESQFFDKLQQILRLDNNTDPFVIGNPGWNPVAPF